MKYNKFCEGYITLKSGLVNTQKLQLSKEFVKAFKKEYSRLIKKGENKNSLHSRLLKSLRQYL